MCSRTRGLAANLVAAALAAVVAPEPAAAAPRPCQLQVSVTPSPVPPGQRTARVRVSPWHDGLHLAASFGEIGPARRDGTRGYVADWTLPAGQAPAMAIVAAVGGGDCGSSAVRLAGGSDEAGGPPRRSATLVAVDPVSVPADHDEEAEVYVFATDANGDPRGGPAPLVTASVGRVRATEALGNGAWRTAWSLQAGEAGPAAVAAQFAGEPSISAALARTAGAATELRVEFDRPRAVPGDPTPIQVGVRVRDALGNPTDAAVEVESDLGEVGPVERLETGVYRATLVIPSALRGSRAILVVAKVEGVSAPGALPIGPGPTAHLRVVPPGPVVGDGSTTSQLEVLVTDAFENPAEDIPEGTSTLGTFVPSSRLGPGRWVMGFRAGRVLQDTPATLVVKAGSVTESVAVDVQASRVSFSVAPKVGVALASGRAGLAAGLEASAWTQIGKAQLGLVLEGAWFSLSSAETVDVGGTPASYDSRQSWVPVLLSVGWRVPLGRRTMLWTSVGGGLALVANESQIAGQPQVSETGLAPSASLAASFGTYAWKGFPFVELRATWVGNPQMTTLTGSIFPVFLLAGYRFDAG